MKWIVKLKPGRKRRPIPEPWPRTRGNSTVYYFSTYDVDGKPYDRSTGEKTLSAARTFIKNLVASDSLFAVPNMTFAKYSAPFFLWDTCPWVKSKRLSGKRLTQEWVDRMRQILTSHITPILGKFSMEEIDFRILETMQDKLLAKDQSTSSVNHAMKVARIIFDEAVRDGLVHRSPFEKVRMVTPKYAEKGILTDQEAIGLLSDASLWLSPIHHCFSILAAATGARMGEILALTHGDLTANSISITKVARRISGVGAGTKTGNGRVVPVAPGIIVLIRAASNWTGYIFSADHGKTPMTPASIAKAYHTALDRKDIDWGLRKISFHSWRHFFNTRALAAGISKEKVQAITEHRTDQMTDHYTHFDAIHLAGIMEMQAGLLVVLE